MKRTQNLWGWSPRMICPKCGFEQADGGIDCLRCGIVFSRYRAAAVPLAGQAAPGAPGGTMYSGESVPAPSVAAGDPVVAGGGAPTAAQAPATAVFAGSGAGGSGSAGSPGGAGGHRREPEEAAVVGMALRPAPAQPARAGGTDMAPSGAGAGAVRFSAAPAFGAGAVLGDTFSIFFRNFIPFLLISAVVVAPVFVAIIALSGTESRGALLALLGAVTLVEGFVVTPVVTGAITFGVVQELRGRDASVGECLSRGVASLLKVFMVAFLQGLVIFGGMIACIVPGLIAAVALSVAVPAAIEERLSASGALRRSSELTKGHRWAVLGVLLLLGVIGFGLGQVAQLLAPAAAAGRPLANLLPSTAISPLTTSLQATAAAVMYYRLRSGVEGIDVAELTSVFD
jgi:hypothetical protein